MAKQEVFEVADFQKIIDDWTKETQQRALAMFKLSVQELISRAQRRIPVDTGFARKSAQASRSAMPSIDPSAKPEAVKGRKARSGAIYAEDKGEIVIVIAGAALGDTIYVGWTANYVQYLEWGHSSQAPSGFVGVTALEWPAIVVSQIDAAKQSVAVNK